MSSSSSPMFSIGNCKVEVEGNNLKSLSCKSVNPNDLQISTSDGSKIKISVNTSRRYNTRKCAKDLLSSMTKESVEGERAFTSLKDQSDYSFVLVNPKDIDSRTESLIQEVLGIYRKELPAMIYAANTGKQSPFLERCVSNGKYCTLLLTSNVVEGSGEVIAAVTFQIIPVDTQYAEVPLAAVCSNYQRKGIGRLLYSELRKRLQNVGARTIFCWGDEESEEFWVKQGFIRIAEIDTKGKARRLPIKADIQRALCFPGGSTLMVSHLSKDIGNLSGPLNHLKAPSKLHANSYSSLPEKNQEFGSKEESHDISKSSFPMEGTELNGIMPRRKNAESKVLLKDGCSIDDEKSKGLSPQCDPARDCRNMGYNNAMGCNDIAISLEGTENRGNDDENDCFCSRQGAKRKIWEASCSSIKSKKVKGGHHIDCHLDSSWDLTSKHGQANSSFDACCLAYSKDKSYVDVPENASKNSNLPIHTDESRPDNPVPNEYHAPEDLLPKGGYHKIMLMNIADDVKKAFLTKIIEELGGVVTSDGSLSTHVVTGKARRTLNFCTALCSGAWIVSTNWLKQSCRENRFVDESCFLLEDEDYVVRYRSQLKEAVLRAKASPGALLKGFDICLAKHVQPPDGILSAIIKSAGGNVVKGVEKVQEASRGIFIACEEDIEEAMIAAETGVWVYTSDWLMSCFMRQELDLQAPQFAESL